MQTKEKVSRCELQEQARKCDSLSSLIATLQVMRLGNPENVRLIHVENVVQILARKFARSRNDSRTK